jgi:hypothetical protein
MIKDIFWRPVDHWDSESQWLLDDTVKFFKTHYKMTPSFRLYDTDLRDRKLIALMDLKGNVRPFKHPEAVCMSLEKYDYQKTFLLRFFDAKDKMIEIYSVKIERAEDTEGRAGHCLADLFDPTEVGNAKLAAYDTAAAIEAEQKRKEADAMKAVQTVMQTHMRQCWGHVLDDIRRVTDLNLLSEFKIQEAMKAVVAQEIKSGNLKAIVTSGAQSMEIQNEGTKSCLDDILRKCDRLGLYT